MPRIIHLLAAITIALASAATTPPQRAALDSLIDRIGGQDAHHLITTEVDTTLGHHTFTISSRHGRPLITGSDLSATTAGLGWYLRHHARIDISWQQPSVDLASHDLPLPADTATHTSVVPIRYYLNYCTFSYSMSTWTWKRWEQEIDWMALHGINAPLQIVGLDTVWRNLLTLHYGYTAEQANQFIAGPAFQAWWAMNNLEGWGGPNPDWWYERQADLARKILSRERSLGMEPVLPGYAGMTPSSFTDLTGIPSIPQGTWCQFRRPYILDPNHSGFTRVAADYYRELTALMGPSHLYSIDPFHEGARTDSIDVPRAYRAIYQALDSAAPGSIWVIQQWDWTPRQRTVLQQVPEGRLLVLDLFSDGHCAIDTYGRHAATYCSLPNFGARTGLFGRLTRVTQGWQQALHSDSNLQGIGTAPEGIGQNQIQYDLVYQLPWMSQAPDLDQWIADYATTRYGHHDHHARKAWQLLLQSALDCRDSRQGPHEAAMCARPSTHVTSASSWGSCEIFYDPAIVARAASELSLASCDGPNYRHDLIDLTRQALTDHFTNRLTEITANPDTTAIISDCRQLLELITDLDTLLTAHPDFRLSTWLHSARRIASEAPGTTTDDADWLETANARTLITTWGRRINAERGGLRDYSYRQWAGMLRDYYLPRWQLWLQSRLTRTDWYDLEHAWASDTLTAYTDPTITLTTQQLVTLCRALLKKWQTP